MRYLTVIMLSAILTGCTHTTGAGYACYDYPATNMNGVYHCRKGSKTVHVLADMRLKDLHKLLVEACCP